MTEMPFAYNVPFFSILLLLMVAMITPFFRKRGKVAFGINMAAVLFCGSMNLALLLVLIEKNTSFTFMMGHFPAPFGNELRAGPFEALLGFVFCFVMALSVLGGARNIFEDVKSKKQYLYFIMLDLLLCSLLALAYTNDMFNAYVFIEINTLVSCAIVMSKDSGKTIVATTRYMIMSCIASGLFLFALSILYGITGQLLMEPLKEAIANLVVTGEFNVPLMAVVGMMALSLAVKSALYPFHTWLPDAHGSATASSSAILSGLVLKGYIVLLIKIIYRVFTPEVMSMTHIGDVIFVLGVLGMIMGSVNALRERHLKKLAAYSSVAQIGYIFMGIGLNSTLGMIAATLHIISHALTKPMIFLSATGLSNVSGHSYEFNNLRGAAHKNKLAGVAFTIGGLSMIGIPLFAGFVSKLFFSMAAFDADWFRLPIVLIALAISTALNAVYYLGAIINIWRLPVTEHGHGHEESTAETHEIETEQENNIITEHYHDEDHSTDNYKNSFGFKLAMGIFIAANFGFGIFFDPIVNVINSGLSLLG